MLKHRSKLLALLTPSISSFCFCVLLSIGAMVAVGLSYQAGKGSIYNYLFGPGSSADLITSSKTTLAALNNTILGNAVLNKVLYFAFWMMVGLAVYIILYAILRGTGAAAENIKVANYANIQKEKILEDFAIKTSVRIAAIFCWIVFTIIFIRVLLPFSGLTARTASSNLISVNGLAYVVSGFIILALSFHIEVVLTRFMFLRVRLFSQQEVGN